MNKQNGKWKMGNACLAGRRGKWHFLHTVIQPFNHTFKYWNYIIIKISAKFGKIFLKISFNHTIALLILCCSIFLFGCGNGDEAGRIEASGNIESTNVTVSSQVTGKVLSLLKDEGEQVKSGDTVLIIDHESLDYQLAQAEAAADAARAQLNLLKNGAREEDIKQAEEAVKQAQVNYDMAKRDRDRMEALFESKSITTKQHEDAVSKLNITAAQLTSAQENLKKLRDFARPEDIRQAEANLKRQLAAVDLLKKQIRDSYVVSPISGIIVKKFFEPGETVTMLSSLFRVSDLNIVDLIIYVSEEELGKVKLGQTAEVSSDTYPNKKYEGKVTYISPEAEFTPKNIQTKDERTKLVFAVKIKIKNPEFELKPGMPADAVVRVTM
ncbi:MAG TPA: efflux RND transporter periplasmic adaptor subunit [Ignavibacteriaceae bacterium]|nr:efflux RND transporter periplasmic adaptor subunit [Ignavibacteriaceae bacterium]